MINRPAGRCRGWGGGLLRRGCHFDSTTAMVSHPPGATAAPDPQLVPPILAEWLSVFRPCFTAPVWNRILVLVAGAVLAPGRRTVTQALRVMGLAGEPQCLSSPDPRCAVPGGNPTSAGSAPSSYITRTACRGGTANSTVSASSRSTTAKAIADLGTSMQNTVGFWFLVPRCRVQTAPPGRRLGLSWAQTGHGRSGRDRA